MNIVTKFINWGKYDLNNMKRLKEIDILRAIAFIFVVEQHTIGGYPNIKGISPIYYDIFKLFYTLAKPAAAAFLCVSAISLVYTYEKKINLVQYYKKRIISIYLPYIIWSCIFLFQTKKMDTLSNVCLQLITGNAYYHLWYMGMVIRIFIYFPLILLVSKKINKCRFKLRIGIFITFIASYYEVSKYQNIISNKISMFLFYNPTDLQKKIINVSPLFWFIYFIIGIYIAMNYKNFKNIIFKYKKYVFITYLILLLYSFLNEMNVIKFQRWLSLFYYISTILSWYTISILLSNKERIYKFFNFIGKYSFVGYIIHVSISIKVVGIVGTYSKDLLIKGFMTWFITVILTTIIVKIITFIPCTKIITGVTPVFKIQELQKIYYKIITGGQKVFRQ